MVFSTQFARVSVHRLQAAATEVVGSELVPDLDVSQESICPVTAGPRGPSFCVGTLGPIDHSPYTVPTLYRDPGPPRSNLQRIVGRAKGDRLETPHCREMGRIQVHRSSGDTLERP